MKQLNTRHLTNHTYRAIFQRLGYAAPYALLAVEREGNAVILRLNSGGNILAVESYLRHRGYRCEDGGQNPDGYGGAIRVMVGTGDEEG